MHMQHRPSNMALAFVQAAVNNLNAVGRKAPWTARRVAINADREIGQIAEPRWNAHLSHKTAEELQRRGIL